METNTITTQTDPGFRGLAQFRLKFGTEAACWSYLESRRWPNGPVCPHCGQEGSAYRIAGKTARPGLCSCKGCHKQFTVTVGTIFERSHLPLTVWFEIIFYMCSSKKGMSAHQIHRMMGVPYKTAWHICQQIRMHFRDQAYNTHLKGVVEIDETFAGGKPRFKRGQKQDGRKAKMDNKTVVVAMVERDGPIVVRPAKSTSKEDLKPLIDRHVSTKAVLMTDEWRAYKGLLASRDHRSVNHTNKVFATIEGTHVNTAESFFAIFKRGYHGTYHHISRKWMSRYCGEFGFRFTTRKLTDGQRFAEVFTGM